MKNKAAVKSAAKAKVAEGAKVAKAATENAKVAKAAASVWAAKTLRNSSAQGKTATNETKQ